MAEDKVIYFLIADCRDGFQELNFLGGVCWKVVGSEAIKRRKENSRRIISQLYLELI